MVLSDTQLEHNFAKIYNKGCKKTLEFIRNIISKYDPNAMKDFEKIIMEENVKTMETTESFKVVQDQFDRLYKPGSIKTLQFIEKNIKTLPEDVLGEIFQIITRNHENYTIKKSEVLINLGKLKEDTIKDIVKFILFIRNSIEQLEDICDQMNTIKSNFSETDAIIEPTINIDPNYNPIIPTYMDGPAPVIEQNTA